MIGPQRPKTAKHQSKITLAIKFLRKNMLDGWGNEDPFHTSRSVVLMA